MHTQNSAQAGFSLAELLIAILILAVGLLGLAELQITAMKGNTKSDSIMEASLLAQQAIEQVMAISNDGDAYYLLLSETDGAEPWPAALPLLDANGTNLSDRYEVTYETTEDFGAGSNIVQVKVEVRSLGGSGFGDTQASSQALKDLKRIVAL